MWNEFSFQSFTKWNSISNNLDEMILLPKNDGNKLCKPISENQCAVKLLILALITRLSLTNTTDLFGQSKVTGQWKFDFFSSYN